MFGYNFSAHAEMLHESTKLIDSKYVRYGFKICSNFNKETFKIAYKSFKYKGRDDSVDNFGFYLYVINLCTSLRTNIVIDLKN